MLELSLGSTKTVRCETSGMCKDGCTGGLNVMGDVMLYGCVRGADFIEGRELCQQGEESVGSVLEADRRAGGGDKAKMP